MDLNGNIKMNKRIVIVGSGVSGISAATKLVDNGYPGELITIIDKGKDPYRRKPEEVMCGYAGAGGFSDGKLTYHTGIGGQLAKYCGEEKAYDLMNQEIEFWKRFHPDLSKIMYSSPQEEPEFIKPYFGLRLFPVYHVGTDYLHEIGKNWYNYLISKGVRFWWETEVDSIDFNKQTVDLHKIGYIEGQKVTKLVSIVPIKYNTLIFAVGKSGIDFSQTLIKKYNLETEAKSAQIGVRFEAPQKYFQRLIDISYDFKLYRKIDNVSLRSFCTNNNAAYVAVEETYGDVSYNGHAKKDPKYENGMTNFGILMEIKGIDDPFKWSRDIVKKCQLFDFRSYNGEESFTGVYYSPSRKPSLTSELTPIFTKQIKDLSLFIEAFGEYSHYIVNFIADMNQVFQFGDDWGMYIPEVKYLSPEPLVDYNNLALQDYPNVHFVGDALSARGITVSGAQGIYVAESILK
jgi:uncharacterized FAD-dependent dehydrogenase